MGAFSVCRQVSTVDKVDCVYGSGSGSIDFVEFLLWSICFRKVSNLVDRSREVCRIGGVHHRLPCGGKARPLASLCPFSATGGRALGGRMDPFCWQPILRVLIPDHMKLSEFDLKILAGALDSLGLALCEESHEWTAGERAVYEEAWAVLKGGVREKSVGITCPKCHLWLPGHCDMDSIIAGCADVCRCERPGGPTNPGTLTPSQHVGFTETQDPTTFGERFEAAGHDAEPVQQQPMCPRCGMVMQDIRSSVCEMCKDEDAREDGEEWKGNGS